MNAVLDSKGNEIKVGSLVKAKGSDIIREVWGNTETLEPYLKEGKIKAFPISTSLTKTNLLNLANVEVVG